jgi:2-polyprenyl-6-methoxyphenol hydroxylase-like FAD-dependent oxidoreductase
METRSTDEIEAPSPTKGSPEVLIVGAGPTGLTLACELARCGVSFRLIEASPGPQPGSRGKGLQPRTLEVFDDLGIVDRILANGKSAMPMLATAPDGTTSISGTDPVVPRPDVPYPLSMIIPEWRVEEALRLRLGELRGAVDFGTSLISLEQSEEGVFAVLAQGDQQETVQVRWLIGCDGGHSLVRKGAGIAFEGETREDVRMIVADMEVDGLNRDAWHAWRHEEGFLALCPLPSTNVFQYQASIAPGQDPELSLANKQGILERRSRRTDIRLHEPEWKSLWRANIRLAERYRNGRVLIAGDAAHIHSPAGGQGMNTGIQDAHNLGWKLAAVINGASTALLDSYEAERRPVAGDVLALSNTLLNEAIKERSVVLRKVASTTQLGINYRDSTLATDDRDGTVALRAGDRAPDATGLKTSECEQRFFDLTRGGRFTLLNFGPAISIEPSFFDLRILRVVEQPVGTGDIADPDGQLAKAYGAGDRTLVLIRPDGYIGLISDAGDYLAVKDYLASVREPGLARSQSATV